MKVCEVPNCGREAVKPGGIWIPWSCEEHWKDFLAWKAEKLNREGIG